MKIKTFIFNDFRQNMYVLYDDSRQCVFVDASCYSQQEQGRLAGFVSEQGLTPVAVVNTHAHIDHIVGLHFLCSHYDIPWYLHPADTYNLLGAEQYGSMFGFQLVMPPKPEPLQPEVCFGNTRLQVIHTPGHTKGGVSFYSKEDGVLFTGDTLFNGSVGRTDLPGGDYEELMHSINMRLLVLPSDTRLLAGHGYESTLGDEQRDNPFLQPIGWEQV